MATQANLRNLIINGTPFSPSGEWTIQVGGRSRETRRNLDGTLDSKEVPEPDMWSGNISWPGKAAMKTLQNSTSLTVTAFLRNGDNVQLTQAVLENHAELDTDGGEVALELAGIARYL